MPYRVGLVGHCGFDAGGLVRAAERALGDVEAVSINDQDRLAAEIDRLNLILVNRLLDGRFPNAEGVDLITSLRADGRDLPIILISNYDDAQEAAQAAGAAAGFGKRALKSPLAEARMRAAVGLEAAS